jgi:hypothetical protein
LSRLLNSRAATEKATDRIQLDQFSHSLASVWPVRHSAGPRRNPHPDANRSTVHSGCPEGRDGEHLKISDALQAAGASKSPNRRGGPAEHDLLIMITGRRRHHTIYPIHPRVHTHTHTHLPIRVRKKRVDLCRCRHGRRAALQLCHSRCICIALRVALPHQSEPAHESKCKGSSSAKPSSKERRRGVDCILQPKPKAVIFVCCFMDDFWHSTSLIRSNLAFRCPQYGTPPQLTRDRSRQLLLKAHSSSSSRLRKGWQRLCVDCRTERNRARHHRVENEKVHEPAGPLAPG